MQARQENCSVHALRRTLATELPQEAFRCCPLRALWVIPLIIAVVGTSLLAAHSTHPLTKVCLSIWLGCLYSSLLQIGHEIGHGATVSSKRLQDLILWFCLLIYLVPPALWRAWHNQAHHRNANRPDVDPDSVGTIEGFKRSGVLGRIFLKFTPGSGSLLSLCFLGCGFTLHAQHVLWRKSYGIGFMPFSRKQAIMELLGMLSLWLYSGFILGLRDAVFVVCLPMIFANAWALIYVVTQHWISPLSDHADPFGGTLSVRTSRVLDSLHFHVSHHVEHHLFPRMNSCYYPLVRKFLVREAPKHYFLIGHVQALYIVFCTPRIYAEKHLLTDSDQKRFVNLNQLRETVLKKAHSVGRLD
jgi:fatty acid desaturase